MSMRAWKIGGITLLVLVVLGAVSGFVWYRTVSRLSVVSVQIFAEEIATAAEDSLLSATDAELLEKLRRSISSPKSSVMGRSLGTGVGIVPLLRRSMTEDDREDIALSTAYLEPRQGNVGLRETSKFLRGHPRIASKMQEFEGLWKRRMKQGPAG